MYFYLAHRLTQDTMKGFEILIVSILMLSTCSLISGQDLEDVTTGNSVRSDVPDNTTVMTTAKSVMKPFKVDLVSLIPTKERFGISTSQSCNCANSSCGCCVSYNGIIINEKVCIAVDATDLCCRQAVMLTIKAFKQTWTVPILSDISICPTIPYVSAAICLHPYGLEFASTKSTDFRICFKMSANMFGISLPELDFNCFLYRDGRFSLGTYSPPGSKPNFTSVVETIVGRI